MSSTKKLYVLLDHVKAIHAQGYYQIKSAHSELSSVAWNRLAQAQQR